MEDQDMPSPNDPSSCCKDKGGKFTGTNPDTHQRTWDPIKQSGKLYCSLCHKEFDSKSSN